MLSQTWSSPVDQPLPEGAEAERIWERHANLTAEPLRSAFLLCSQEGRLNHARLGQWPTIAWDNRGGRITLAGDAAHVSGLPVTKIRC